MPSDGLTHDRLTKQRYCLLFEDRFKAIALTQVIYYKESLIEREFVTYWAQGRVDRNSGQHARRIERLLRR